MKNSGIMLLTVGLMLGPAGRLSAQGSPYIPLDDPRLPSFEHLITRGEVSDPSPLVRPFRRADALEALSAADTAGAPGRRLIQELRAAWVQDTAAAHWSLGVRGGGEAYTSARRDPLRPAGDGGGAPYGELAASATFGPLLMVSRSAVEPRLTDDPDWPGRHDLKVVGRMAEGYLSGQWRWGRLFYGTMDRQWGPGGVEGIPLSPYAYPRTELAVDLGSDRLRLSAHAATLTDAADSAGARVHRYWFAHRLSVRPSERLSVGLWETVVISGVDRGFDARWRNPLAVLLLSDQYGLGADGNIMVGADLSWWATRRSRIEAQLAIDDVNYPNAESTDHTPSRYAFTVAVSGPLAGASAYKLLYTQASSLAFRTFDPGETYADAGVGLGRGTGGHDQLSLFTSRPLGVSWLLSPELTLRRQGESELGIPYPAADAGAGNVPPVFIGTIEKTWRAALGVSGAYGPLHAAANVGLHYVQDADHVAGRSRTEVEGRIRFTLGTATGGPLQ